MQDCEVCRCRNTDMALVSWAISLGSLQTGVLEGCEWCEFFMNCASLYEDKWAHLRRDHTNQVYYEVNWMPFSDIQEAELSLNWPSSINTAEPSTYLEPTEPVIDSIRLEFEVQDHLRHVPLWLPLKTNPSANTWCHDSAAPQYFALIESWIKRCESDHPECKVMRGNSLVNPKRLLQISSTLGESRVHLVQVGKFDSPRYTALSHCWGNTPGFKTTRQNLEAHTTKGIMISKLPRTYQHAIDITKRIGCEYVWIDSICIIQDSNEEWELACETMGHIYGNAHVVIGATLAPNGSAGIYTDRKNEVAYIENRGKRVPILVREKIRHDVWQNDEPSWQAWNDQGMPLFRRAWAFQERLLARRIQGLSKLASIFYAEKLSRTLTLRRW
ncbi:heterokaryon incompatibility protein-domain-containing protein [Aspergillus transmontanensis]|uniref:Heterokaryon incompatibility protein-domain-containing protein n=1 Tax=Aspergillus transmontanensis TaxID=1034304 RepID=A0A5N6VR70_9EURO|nr:heterokaryon incompatibility protein-domain-containing protein [Aspergillus transmontanensis]